jgi:hypothetical protein
MDPKTIPWRGEISLQQMLVELRDDSLKPFWIAFVRASGKNAGSIKVVSSARYGSPLDGSKNTGSRTEARPKAKVMHTEKGTLPITDTTNGEYLTPLISHIVGYNLFKVKH